MVILQVIDFHLVLVQVVVLVLVVKWMSLKRLMVVVMDLPPKIIQDYTCRLTDLQLQLHDNFMRSQGSKIVSSIKGIRQTEVDHAGFIGNEYIGREPAHLIKPGSVTGAIAQ